ncbi:uncharacterized protein LOC120628331 [Pararge aegeria]|nr:uncharacterized protein LOC120628331 [Pararge aegeria]XP_039752584.1 uncharacterized protein LOC120628331 [Pararge aegeria]XP_039752585.1 uncharacterized protein LOC120628331 [Pararge aegeria]XP_039752586.1 uncharacterized protein LOC120628331 [Pararge aegeria]XP_039752587.1 uncharacterized protein LOC120628331 [Pararge aegeria]
MESVDNNKFEVKSSKRKIVSGPNVYLNPALDLLVNEDPICNTAMEITPNKRRKRTKSDIAAFENTALDLGISKTAVNEFLQRELENVRKNTKCYETPIKIENTESVPNHAEPIYANLTDLNIQNTNWHENAVCSNGQSKVSHDNTDIMCTGDGVLDYLHENTVGIRDNTENDIAMQDSQVEMDSGISGVDQKSLNAHISGLETNDISAIRNTTNIQTKITNQIFMNNSNLSLSFIDRLAIESPGTSDQSYYFDDDLNESNIMEIKTITIITKKKLVPNKRNTNPFLNTNVNVEDVPVTDNPFLDNQDLSKPELEYNIEAMNRPVDNVATVTSNTNLVPRKLFTCDTNSTISTVDESVTNPSPEYENIDSYRSESPIYENIGEEIPDEMFNKQSKLLGCDVSQFSAIDIMNLNKNSQINNSNESNDSKKHLKHSLLKASNKFSKKVFKTLKKKFKGEKVEHNATLNPYEVPRKQAKEKNIEKKDTGIENPALKLDNSDEIEIEEIDDEHEYETIKTVRNTQMNTNVTPLKERAVDNFDVSNKSYTPGKKVRFDSTLNREKIITGNSFDCDIQSPGFDSKIEKYHDELENCINERKFLEQHM